MTISSWLNFGRPAPPGRGLRRDENFRLRLTTASAQCLPLSERFFFIFYVFRFYVYYDCSLCVFVLCAAFDVINYDDDVLLFIMTYRFVRYS